MAAEVIRDELLSVERLEERAEVIARDRVDPAARPDPDLLARGRDNARVLLRCYRVLAAVIEDERAVTPAAEWLVDNFHIVDDTLAEVRIDLPAGFYRKLPVLGAGPRQGVPRVFGLARMFVAHTDSRFEPATLRRYLLAFQRVQPLLISELWAVPIALRIILVENLRRLSEQIVAARAARLQADRLADTLLGRGPDQADPRAVPRAGDDVSTAFILQLALRLRDQDPRATPAVRWLEERLAAAGTSPEALARSEHQRQATANVTVRNIITSLRVMAPSTGARSWRA